MASYTISRKDIKGEFTAAMLKARLNAFVTLYCNQAGHDGCRVYIHGAWFTDTNRPIVLDGNSDARVIHFGVSGLSVTIKYCDDMGEQHRMIVLLTPEGDSGFSEITFLTVDKARELL